MGAATIRIAMSGVAGRTRLANITYSYRKEEVGKPLKMSNESWFAVANSTAYRPTTVVV